MKIQRRFRFFLAIIGSILAILVLVLFVMLVNQAMVSKRINDDISDVYSDKRYSNPVMVDGLDIVMQDISCGYACIEMLSAYLDKDITEQILYEQNDGKISTAMGNGFVNEMNKQFKEYNTTKHKNLKNSKLIDMMYQSLAGGMPVPIEFVAQYDDGDTKEWTLHFAIVTAVDIPNDTITVHNPYGYIENYTVDDFLNATRYDSYVNMPVYFEIGFGFSIVNENTIYIIE